MRISDWSSDVCSSDLAMTFLSQHVSLAPRVRFKPAIGVPGAISVIRKRGGLTVAALLLSGTLLISGCSEEEQPQQAAAPTAPAVTTATVSTADVTPSAAFNGRIEAVDRVELRARVEGFIEKRQ